MGAEGHRLGARHPLALLERLVGAVLEVATEPQLLGGVGRANLEEDDDAGARHEAGVGAGFGAGPSGAHGFAGLVQAANGAFWVVASLGTAVEPARPAYVVVARVWTPSGSLRVARTPPQPAPA